uniref:Uncharacterized protein n=1 Tax=Panagrolaimus sp. PS1159 TaxID=55785 RepID=A0AC35ERT7_9BILA
MTTYENSIASDLFDDENIEGVKKEKFGSIKTSKQSFTDAFNPQNSFEFPRQQDEVQRNDSEIMQFKASQQLFDSSPSLQNDEHINQRPIASGYDTSGAATTTINSTSTILSTSSSSSSTSSTYLLTILTNPIFIIFAVIVLILAVLSMIGTILSKASSTVNTTYDFEQLDVKPQYIVVPLQCTCEPQADP